MLNSKRRGFSDIVSHQIYKNSLKKKASVLDYEDWDERPTSVITKEGWEDSENNSVNYGYSDSETATADVSRSFRVLEEILPSRIKSNKIRVNDENKNLITEAKLQELIKENVFLTREVERLNDDIKELEKKHSTNKEEVYNGLVERHERRVKLVKEEFDFKLKEEAQRSQLTIAEVKSELQKSQERTRELEEKVRSLEVSNHVVEEKFRNEQRHVQTLQSTITTFEEQSSAALRTVSQFSEKNISLGRELEEIRKTLDIKEREIQNERNMIHHVKLENQSFSHSIESLNLEISTLRENLSAQISVSHEIELKLHATETKSCTSEKLAAVLKDDLMAQNATLNALKDEIKEGQENKQQLISTCNELRSRAQQSLDVAERCTAESSSLRQEIDILRQRLEEQQESLRCYKHFVLKNNLSSQNEAMTTTRSSNVELSLPVKVHRKERNKDPTMKSLDLNSKLIPHKSSVMIPTTTGASSIMSSNTPSLYSSQDSVENNIKSAVNKKQCRKTTRLVKVHSPSGTCRYELQQLCEDLPPVSNNAYD